MTRQLGYWVATTLLGVAAFFFIDAAYAPCEVQSEGNRVAGVALAYAAGGVFQARNRGRDG